MAALEYRVRDAAEDAGWSDRTVMGLLVEYIENQQDDDALMDFLQRRAAEENDAADTAASEEVVARVGKIKAPQHDDDGWD